VELTSELLYAIISTLFLCYLLICYPYILLHFLMFFILVISSFAHFACLSYCPLICCNHGSSLWEVWEKLTSIQSTLNLISKARKLI